MMCSIGTVERPGQGVVKPERSFFYPLPNALKCSGIYLTLPYIPICSKYQTED